MMEGRRCDTCGNAVLRRYGRPGRIEKYKGLSFVMPETLALIECEACGERYDASDDLDAIEKIAKEMYQQRTRNVIESALQRLTAGRSLAELERQLCLSVGYLSKIKKSEEPSFQLVALLALLAENPASLDVLASIRGDAEVADAQLELDVHARKRA